MGWNYRVVRAADDAAGSGLYGIHEAYYTDGKLTGWTEEPVGVVADTSTDLLTVLAMMADALGHPVLDAETGKEIEPARELSDNLRRALSYANRDLFDVDLTKKPEEWPASDGAGTASTLGNSGRPSND